MNDYLQFTIFTDSDNILFKVSQCNPDGILFEGVIYSPNYDLVIYFINSSLFQEVEQFFYNVKIEINGENKKMKFKYNLKATFSAKKYVCRFSGLFEELQNQQLSVKVSFQLKNSKIPNLNKSSFQKKFYIVPLESIQGDEIYYDEKMSDKNKCKDISEMSDLFRKNYYYYLSFYGTQELIGPVEKESIKESGISHYFTTIFPIQKSVIEKVNDSLAFFVENFQGDKSFFGLYPIKNIKRIFGKEYINLNVNNQPFDSNRNYLSGTIVYGDHKSDY